MKDSLNGITHMAIHSKAWDLKPAVVIVLLTSAVFLGCDISTRKAPSNQEESISIELELAVPSDSLKEALVALNMCRLNFQDLYPYIENNRPYQNNINSLKNEWLKQYQRDTFNFDQPHYIKPLCKFFENEDILSVAFTDMYDYKQAIHVFNFRKPGYDLASSFIVFSIGGDAEDFWRREAEQNDEMEFTITDENGYLNDIETADTIFYHLRRISIIQVDTTTGVLKKAVLREQRDFYELNK